MACNQTILFAWNNHNTKPSTMKKAGIYLLLDKTDLQAGHRLKGTIIIEVTCGYIKAQSIQVTFYGGEETNIMYSAEGGHQVKHSYSERFYQKSLSVDAGKIIQGHRIFNGHHEIPFQIQLPQTLISSRRIVHDHDSSCVKYCLEAELKGSRLFHQYKANAEVLVQNKEETPPPLILHSWHADYLASASNSLVARRTGFCRS